MVKIFGWIFVIIALILSIILSCIILIPGLVVLGIALIGFWLLDDSGIE